MSTTKTKARTRPVLPKTRAEAKTRSRALDGRGSRVASAAVGDDDGSGGSGSPEGSVGELWLYGVVGGWWRGFDAESVAEALRGMDVDTLYVRIHSPGGYAPDGIAIGNLLRNHKARVIVVVDGLAASAASVIAIAGDEIVMCPGSQMMIHDAWTFGYGNAAELRTVADWIDGQSDNYAGVYRFKAGGTVAQWRAVMTANSGEGTWYTAEATVAAGLADSVGTRIAQGSPPVAPEDDLDDDDLYARALHDVELLEQLVHPAARAAWRGDGAPKPPSASAVGSTHTEGGSAVAFSDEQLTTMRQQLGLAEDADEATITAALTEALEERAEDTATAPTPTPATSPTTTTPPEGMVLVDSTVLDGLRSDASAGRAVADRIALQDRDTAINAAIADGRTTPARRKHWEASWQSDAEGTAEMLAALEPGLAVPVAEVGHSGEPAEGGGTSLADVRKSPEYQNWSM